MRILFVFDGCLITKSLPKRIKAGDIIYLFPLTSKSSVISEVIQKIKRSGCDCRILESARLINISAENLRGKYMRFVADFPKQFRHRSRDLKDIFAVDKQVSLWWFSRIAEKNTFKTDSFNRLAQFDAIVQIIKKEKIERIISGCQSEKLNNALYDYTRKNRINFRTCATKAINRFKRGIREAQKLPYLKHVIILLYFIINNLWRTREIKREIGPMRRAVGPEADPLLIFTCYPNIDEPAARSGVFKNKFYTRLQEALENNKQNIIWIAIYEYFNIPFKKSLEYAKSFIKNGYAIYFVEEFNSLGAQVRAFFKMLKTGLRFLALQRRIRAAHDLGDYNIYPLFKDDWYSSFVGETGYSGVLHYYIFRDTFKRLRVRRCLYLCEMQSWEKALISARDAVDHTLLLLGYQSGTVSRMLLNYFNDPKEMAGDSRYAIPWPDKIICNGRLPYGYMKESGWPEERLSIVEAIRFIHFKKYRERKWEEKKNIVLLAFSISPEESSSILNVVYEAFKDRPEIEVWLQPHPSLRLQSVFELSGIPMKGQPFKINGGTLSDALLKARVVIAGESSVSIEAIACGCEVVIVNVPEWISMSPLKNIESGIVRSVSSPQELRTTIIDIFQNKQDSRLHAQEAEKIIGEFFYLNQESDAPQRFLSLLGVRTKEGAFAKVV